MNVIDFVAIVPYVSRAADSGARESSRVARAGGRASQWLYSFAQIAVSVAGREDGHCDCAILCEWLPVEAAGNEAA